MMVDPEIKTILSILSSIKWIFEFVIKKLPEDNRHVRRIKNGLTSDYQRIEKSILVDETYEVKHKFREMQIDTNLHDPSDFFQLSDEEIQQFYPQIEEAKNLAVKIFEQSLVKDPKHMQNPILLLNIMIFCATFRYFRNYGKLMRSYKEYLEDIEKIPKGLKRKEKEKLIELLNGIVRNCILFYVPGKSKEQSEVLTKVESKWKDYKLKPNLSDRFQNLGGTFVRVYKDYVRCFPMNDTMFPEGTAAESLESGLTVALIVGEGSKLSLQDILSEKNIDGLSCVQKHVRFFKNGNQDVMFEKVKQIEWFRKLSMKLPTKGGVNFIDKAQKREIMAYVQALWPENIVVIKPYDEGEIYVIRNGENLLIKIKCEIPKKSAMVACEMINEVLHIVLIDRPKEKVIVLKSKENRPIDEMEFKETLLDLPENTTEKPRLREKSRAVTISDSGEVFLARLELNTIKLYNLSTGVLQGRCAYASGASTRIVSDICFVHRVLCVCVSDEDDSKPSLGIKDGALYSVV